MKGRGKTLRSASSPVEVSSGPQVLGWHPSSALTHQSTHDPLMELSPQNHSAGSLACPPLSLKSP